MIKSVQKIFPQVLFPTLKNNISNASKKSSEFIAKISLSFNS